MGKEETKGLVLYQTEDDAVNQGRMDQLGGIIRIMERMQTDDFRHAFFRGEQSVRQ